MAFKKAGRKVAMYSTIVGALYTIIGVIEIIGEIGLEPPFMEMFFIPPSVFGGLMLLIIGIVYLSGIQLQRQGRREGLSYLAVGALLSAVFFGVYVCTMGANALGHVVGFEDWLEWTLLDDVRPGIWLFPLTLPAAYIVLSKKEWRG